MRTINHAWSGARRRRPTPWLVHYLGFSNVTPSLSGCLSIQGWARCHVNGMTYTLCGKLGDGAAGVVRRATRDSNGSEVAIKFLAPDPKYIEESSFDDVAERFRHEGRRGARLDHPRLVTVIDYAENSNSENFEKHGPSNPFIIMEYVSGHTLEGRLRASGSANAGRFDVTRDRLFIAIQLADAICHIHSHRLVHRDVKPANIFISGQTKRAHAERSTATKKKKHCQKKKKNDCWSMIVGADPRDEACRSICSNCVEDCVDGDPERELRLVNLVERLRVAVEARRNRGRRSTLQSVSVCAVGEAELRRLDEGRDARASP